MHEDESLYDFYTKLCDIANESFTLSEKIPETTFVRKIIRFLPDRFSSKVIAIEEAKDLDSMKAEDLMGSLRAFEMTLKQRKREKSIVLKIVHKEEDSSEEDIDDEFTLLTMNFKKFLKKVGKSSKSSSSFPNTFKGKNSSENLDFTNNKKIIQCRECEDYRHIQSQCADTRKKKSKALKSTWSDDESDGSQEDDSMVSNQVAFSGTLVLCNRVLVQGYLGSVATDSVYLFVKLDTIALDSKIESIILCGSNSDSGEESENDDEYLQEAYEKMYTLWLKVCATNRALDSENQELCDLKKKVEGKV